MVHYDKVEPTCEETGLAEHYLCKKCNRYFSDQYGNTELDYDEDVVIKALGHDTYSRQEDRVEPTCTNFGHYYIVIYCDRCKEVVSRTVIGIPYKGHEWGDPVYEWTADNSSVTAKKVCKNDPSHVISETAETVSEVSLEPTCSTKGKTTYTAEFLDSSFVTQTKTLENIDALGHDYKTPTYTWSEDDMTVSAYTICERCDHEEKEDVITSQTIAKEPTCTEKGATTYTAEFTNPLFEKQSKTVKDIDALGHKWDAGKVIRQATCEESGLKKYTCLNDSEHVKEEEIDALGHIASDPVYENIVEAKCTEKGGYDVVVYCDRCQKELSRDYHSEPELGHKWGEWKEIKPATETQDGIEERTCSRCGEKQSRVIPMIDHVHKMVEVDEVKASCTSTGVKKHFECSECKRYYLDADGLLEVEFEELIIPLEDHQRARRTENRVEATCTNFGHYDFVIYCEKCSEVISRTIISIPKLGHKWADPVYTWSKDDLSCEAKRICLNDNSHVESEVAEVIVETTKEATPTSKGEKTYTAEFTNPAFKKQVKTVEYEYDSFTVRFNKNGATSADIPSQKVKKNNKASRPKDPVKSNYEVAGWYIDNGLFNEEWNFNDPVTQDIDLIARYGHTVEFKQAGKTISTVMVYEDQKNKLERPAADPTKSGYKFDYWAKSDGTPFDFDNEQISSDISLMAVFYRYGYTGNEQTWILNDSGDLPFRFVRYQFMVSDYEDKTRDLVKDFEEKEKLAYVDDVLLKEGQYVYSKGSLLIRLDDSYLNSLSVGKHSLRVVFSDGEVTSYFYVRERTKPSSRDYVIPKTGE